MFWRALVWKIFGVFYSQIDYFVDILDGLWPFDNFGTFSPFWYIVPRKIWQPRRKDCSQTKLTNTAKHKLSFAAIEKYEAQLPGEK
jgi:hypothetical protein